MDNDKLVYAIADRAEELDIVVHDKLSLIMDMEVAHKEFNLRLKDLLNSKDMDFVHDVVGIQNHIDRDSESFPGLFVPRYANVEEE